MEPRGTETSGERKRWASVFPTHFITGEYQPEVRVCAAGPHFSSRLIRIIRSAVSKAERRSSSIKIRWSPASAATGRSFETLMRAVSEVCRAVWVDSVKVLYLLEEPGVKFFGPAPGFYIQYQGVPFHSPIGGDKYTFMAPFLLLFSSSSFHFKPKSPEIFVSCAIMVRPNDLKVGMAIDRHYMLR